MNGYGDVGRKEETPVVRSEYLFRDEWERLTPGQRVIHSNRNLPKGCTHKASLEDWPEGLREAYSYDPYNHTTHTEKL